MVASVAQPDLVIRRGTVVDGTGSPPFVADIAVTGDKIVAVGPDLDVKGKVEQDANGLLVAPGWIDPHTHYDAQWSWDAYLTPSGPAGVTTCMMGNCGIGLAPCQADRRKFLGNLIESVEDIPEPVIAAGMTYDFETFEEYLDAIERRPLAVDIGVLVSHCAIRTWVMGKRANLADRPQGPNENPIKPQEIKDMAALVQDAVAVGAFGFSTSRLIAHRDPQNNLTPGSLAGRDELLAITGAIVEGGGGVFEMAHDFQTFDDHLVSWPNPKGSEKYALDAYRKNEMSWMVEAAQKHRGAVSFTYNCFPGEFWEPGIQTIHEINKAGGFARGQCFGRPQGFILSLEGRFHHFVLSDTWKRIRWNNGIGLVGTELLEAMRDSETRRIILEETTTKFTNWKKLDGPTQQLIIALSPFHEVFPYRTDCEPLPEESIVALSKAAGKTRLEYMYDVMASGNLLWKPQVSLYGKYEGLRGLLEHPEMMPGFADAGAHGTMFTDAVTATHNLVHWVRDRTQGPRIKLETIVQKQTSEVARLFGMDDRGTLKPGMRADINIIDFDRLKQRPPFIASDLPLGQTRWTQEVEGYVATFVGGTPTFRDGKPTGLLPGRLLRNPRRKASAWQGIAHQVSGPFDSSVEVDATSAERGLNGQGGGSAVARVLRTTVEAEQPAQPQSRL